MLDFSTWTPKVRRIMAFEAILVGFGLLFTYFWGPGRAFLHETDFGAESREPDLLLALIKYSTRAYFGLLGALRAAF